jgi:MoxR-like ATPase
MSQIQKALISLKNHISEEIIGQDELVERMLIGLLADGHILVEGAPGLAKTRAINVLSQGIEGDFHRVQFTPDLLPADLTGTEIYRPQQGTFEFQKGPLFHNLILADEINRSPAKLDRFLLQVKVDYPNAEHEKTILRLVRAEARQAAKSLKKTFEKITQETLFAARNEVLNLHMSEPLEDYLLQIILATRKPFAYGEDLASWLQYGASPRATISLDRCARAKAWLAGRDFVSPDDIQEMAFDVLRHRLILSYEAEAQGMKTDNVIKELVARIPVP